MKCMHLPATLESDCPTSATHLLERRTYCVAHAPASATKLDEYAFNSAMADDDKAAVYDGLAEYLRKQGWAVVREGRSPLNKHVFQTWQHPSQGENSFHDTLSAYKLECYADAPRQGERSKVLLSEISERIEKKKGNLLNKELKLRFKNTTYVGDVPGAVEALPPGGEEIIEIKAPEMWKGIRAEAVEGIDYASFEVFYVAVGALPAWRMMGFGGSAYQSALLLERWDMPMILAPEGTPIAIRVRNVSVEAKPFAIDLVGLVLNEKR